MRQPKRHVKILEKDLRQLEKDLRKPEKTKIKKFLEPHHRKQEKYPFITIFKSKSDVSLKVALRYIVNGTNLKMKLLEL